MTSNVDPFCYFIDLCVTERRPYKIEHPYVITVFSAIPIIQSKFIKSKKIIKNYQIWKTDWAMRLLGNVLGLTQSLIALFTTLNFLLQKIKALWGIGNIDVPVISKTLEHIETFDTNYKDSS